MKNNIFAQRIGIYYKINQWRDYLLDDILNNLPKELVVRCVKNNYKPYIELIDGSYIQFVPINDSAKGFAWTKVFVPTNITCDEYFTFVRPYIKPYGFPAIVIDRYEDMYCGGRLADIWYWAKYLENERENNEIDEVKQ